MSDTNTNSSGGTLTVYQRMPDQLEAVKVLGTAIAKSRMFGCENVESGMVFATECMFRNLPPLSLAQRYYVIFGKLSMKAEAMLAGFEAEGGTYEVVARSPEIVSIKMTPPGGKATILALSWEEAQREPFVYEGKEEAIVAKLLAGQKPPLKPKYATPRSRMQMLWARLVSDSVRFLCPRVVSGVYTPEENSDIADDEAAHASGNGQSKPSAATVAQSASVVEQAAAPEKPSKEIVSGPVVDAEFEAIKTTTATAQPEFATDQQRMQIESLFNTLGVSGDNREAALKKRNASTTRDLTFAAAGELIAALEKKQAEVNKAKQAAKGKEPAPLCGPCTPDQEKSIKTKFQEWFQVEKDKAQAGLTALGKKLNEAGRKTIIQMSANDAARLYFAVQNKNLEGWLSRPLEPWTKTAVVDQKEALLNAALMA
jgi:hypothetical protein